MEVAGLLSGKAAVIPVPYFEFHKWYGIAGGQFTCLLY
jgi:hypothetical protein